MPGVHRRSRNCLRRMAQSRRRRAGVGTIGTRPAIKGAQPFDAAGLGFIFLPVPATLSFLPGNSTASRHARSGSKTLTLGQLAARSAGHTSELQTLMRITYTVFCLNTKTNKKYITHT